MFDWGLDASLEIKEAKYQWVFTVVISKGTGKRRHGYSTIEILMFCC